MFTFRYSFRIGVGVRNWLYSQQSVDHRAIFSFLFSVSFSLCGFSPSLSSSLSLSFSFAIAFGHAQRFILSKNESSTLLTSFFLFGHSRNCCGDKQEFVDRVFRFVVASLALNSLASTQFFVSFCLAGFPMRLLSLFRLILIYFLCGPERFYCFRG